MVPPVRKILKITENHQNSLSGNREGICHRESRSWQLYLQCSAACHNKWKPDAASKLKLALEPSKLLIFQPKVRKLSVSFNYLCARMEDAQRNRQISFQYLKAAQNRLVRLTQNPGSTVQEFVYAHSRFIECMMDK